MSQKKWLDLLECEVQHSRVITLGSSFMDTSQIAKQAICVGKKCDHKTVLLSISRKFRLCRNPR